MLWLVLFLFFKYIFSKSHENTKNERCISPPLNGSALSPPGGGAYCISLFPWFSWTDSRSALWNLTFIFSQWKWKCIFHFAFMQANPHYWNGTVQLANQHLEVKHYCSVQNGTPWNDTYTGDWTNIWLDMPTKTPQLLISFKTVL